MDSVFLKQATTDIMLKANDHIELPDVLKLPRTCLKTGEWKNIFEEEECRQMMAVALNSCIGHQHKKHTDDFGLRIAGYLITKNMLYLVLDMEQDNVADILLLFYETLQEMIRDKMIHQEISGNDGNAAVVIPLSIPDHHQLFKKHAFNNDALVKLLTGHSFRLRYYDPQLARLKDFLHHHHFCSLIDYAGGEGPVQVSPERLKQHNNINKQYQSRSKGK
jgi:hypothetical protein